MVFHLLKCCNSLLNVCAVCEQMFHLSLASFDTVGRPYSKQKLVLNTKFIRDSNAFLVVCL